MGLYKYNGNNFTKIINREYPAISTNRIKDIGIDYLTGDVIFVTYPEDSVYKITNSKIKKISYSNNSNKYIFNEFDKCLLSNSQFNRYVINYLRKRYFKKEYDSPYNSIIKVKENFLISMYNTLFFFNPKKKTQKITFKNTKWLQLLYLNDTAILIDYSLRKQKIFNCVIDKNSNLKLVPIDADTIFKNYLTKKTSLKYIFGSNPERKILFDGINYFLNFEGVIYKLSCKNNRIETQDTKINPKKHILNTITSSKKNDLQLCYLLGQNISIYYPVFFNVIQFKDENKNNCYSVAIFNKNWYSDTNWIYRLDHNQHKIKEVKTNNISRGFFLPFNDKLYYSGKNYLLYETETNKKLDSYNIPYYSHCGFTYFKNGPWVCDRKRISFLEDNCFKIDTFFENKKKQLEIHTICSFNEHIVIGTSKGVYYYKPFSNLTIIKGLEKVYARYIKVIDKNNFWVGCYGDGLFLVHHGKVYKVNDLSFDMSAVHAVEEDSAKNLWISTNSGLLTVNKVSAIKKILKNKPIECYRFSMDDGLPTNEFNGGGTHPSLNDRGILGFTSAKGFVWFDPKKIKKHNFSGGIVIDKVTQDGKEIKPLGTNYIIKPKAQIINFEIDFGYYFNRENLTVEYCLSDDSVWHKIKDNSFQIARTSSGKCKMLIRIHTHGFDSKNDVIKEIVLDFQPKFKETAWFWAIATILLILLVYLGFQIGLKVNKQREELLKRKIDIKTLELKNTIDELALSKEEVIKSLNDKEILLREIHHRVKNNLQLVISLLDIQGRKNNYQSIDEFLKKGETRIIAMALIHQHLYQEESLENLKVYNYIENLTSSLLDTFQIDVEKVKIEIQASDVVLNLQTAIPFGLIINELVTNSLKYAFTSDKEGKIKINLTAQAMNEFELVVEDDGIGFNRDKLNKKTFGLELINLLVDQLNGSMEFFSGKTTNYKITFTEISI